MPYMLLIVEPVGQRRERTDEEGRALYAEMLAFSDRLKQRDVLIASQSLRTDADAVRVKVRAGKPLVTDGPFAETKEMIGGYFLLACEDKAQAVGIAAECPAAGWATVEVRELGPCFT
jgi:hypothetical protein